MNYEMAFSTKEMLVVRDILEASIRAGIDADKFQSMRYLRRRGCAGILWSKLTGEDIVTNDNPFSTPEMQEKAFALTSLTEALFSFVDGLSADDIDEYISVCNPTPELKELLNLLRGIVT